ncbi:hypothetical protein QTP86_031930, partial [Hemibagrus guttatus]
MHSDPGNSSDRANSGELVTDPAEIHKQTVIFYSKLYRSELTAVQELEEDFFQSLPKLTEGSARELDMELTLEELEAALNSMENGRSPGIDGLSVEFYKAFWSVLLQDLLEVLRASLNEDQMPLSSRRAVLTLIQKKGDLTDIGAPSHYSAQTVSDTVSKPYSMAALTTVLYTFPLILADIFRSQGKFNVISSAKKLLTGPENLSWRGDGGWGLD